MLSNIIWGLIGIAVGAAMIKWRRPLINFTGSWGWAEKYLGIGGSYTAAVLVAIFLILLSITKMLGKLDNMFQSTLGQFF